MCWFRWRWCQLGWLADFSTDGCGIWCMYCTDCALSCMATKYLHGASPSQHPCVLDWAIVLASCTWSGLHGLMGLWKRHMTVLPQIHLGSSHQLTIPFREPSYVTHKLCQTQDWHSKFYTACLVQAANQTNQALPLACDTSCNCAVSISKAPNPLHTPLFFSKRHASNKLFAAAKRPEHTEYHLVNIKGTTLYKPVHRLYTPEKHTSLCAATHTQFNCEVCSCKADMGCVCTAPCTVLQAQHSIRSSHTVK
jgi:hypothetical protein